MSSGAAAVAAASAAAQYLATQEGKDSQDTPSSADKAWEADGEQQRLRARKLEALADKELTPTMMRSLFRLLDGDGSFELSAAEIQQGMLLLGFKDAHDPVAMTRLLQDIDEDRTGTITEGEFMGFFSSQTRASVAARLKSYVTNQVAITATFFGVDSAGKKSVRTEHVPAAKLKSWISSLPPQRGRLWLDVVGYSPSVHTVLAASLGISHKNINSAILFQPPGARVLSGVHGSPPVAEIVLHCMTCSSDPLVDGGVVGSGCCGKRDESSDGKALASKAHILGNPPAISMEQAAIIVTDDRTMVTLRAPSFSEGGQAGSSSSSSSSSVHPGEEADVGPDPSTIKEVYAELRAKMAASTAETAPLFSSSIKALAVCLIDHILQRNFALRDGITDWQEVLEREIRKQPNSLHTPHLDALGKMSQSAQRALEPLGKALNPEEWQEEVVAPSADSEAEAETADIDVPQLRTQKSTKMALSPASEARVGALRSASEAADSMPMPITGLSSFFSNYIVDFKEMSTDVITIAAAVEGHKKDVERLTNLLSSLKADFMNRTLFALTLITAVSVPVTFLTGLWGMNFEDMTELRGPDNPDYTGFGYKTFWIAVSAVVFLEILGMSAMGLFDALR